MFYPFGKCLNRLNIVGLILVVLSLVCRESLIVTTFYNFYCTLAQTDLLL